MKEISTKVWLGFLIPLFVMVGLVSCSHKTKEADLDGRISAANSEGKVVMLELGSEGCIPCEKMKPVMKKLKDEHGGKIEVMPLMATFSFKSIFSTNSLISGWKSFLRANSQTMALNYRGKCCLLATLISC